MENYFDGIDGNIDPNQYFLTIEEDEEDEKRQAELNARLLKTQLQVHIRLQTESRIRKPQSKRKRSTKKRLLEYVDDDGNVCTLTPKKTFWYQYYILNGNNLDAKALNKFRRRFRLPYQQFNELLQELEESERFRRWKKGTKCCFGEPSSPMSLLVLGALRYLGRGWTFDDIEESTAISEETHRQFFHIFIDYCSNNLFNKHVIMPSTADEARTHIHDFAIGGLPGCVSSTDATHIAMGCCAYQLRHLHKGFKLNSPSRTYNLSCNHRRRILYTTSGHPARWNDKTLQRFDKFMTGIYSGTLLDDVAFQLDDTNNNGERIKVQYQGAWNIVDNGYMHWSTCIPPMKLPVLRCDTRWSEWIESMRKDVECCFGIIKGRFRILKSPIRTRSIESVDKIWKTCCALHNWLLDIDGLDKEWQCGVLSSDWEGQLGDFDTTIVPFAIQRMLLATPAYQSFDASGMGSGDDIVDDNIQNNTTIAGRGLNAISTTHVNVVRQLSHNLFRQKLIKHFHLNFEDNTIIWPRHKKRRII